MRIISGLLLVTLLLASCAPGRGPAGTPQAWIDRPLDGSVLPLAEVEVMSHAADPAGIDQFELDVNGVMVNKVSPAAGGTIVVMNQTWDPPAPGTYILEVRAMNSTGVWSAYAQVIVTIADEPSAPILESAPSPTGTATPTLVPTPTALVAPPKFIPNLNANCRAGPGLMYDILGALLPGSEYTIEGVNQANTWWYMRMPNDTRCWGSMATGTTTYPPRDVPVVLDPPTPTPIPAPTQQAPVGCYDGYNQQNQPICVVPCPAQANPGGVCTP